MRGMIRRAIVVAVPAMALLGLAAGAASASGVAASWSPTTSPGIFSYNSHFNNGQPVNPGQTFSQKFTLTNSGSAATSALKITLTPSSAFAASHDACTGTSLGPKKSCSISITYTAPDATGQTQQATLTATSPKPTAMAASVTLTGTVAVPHTAPVLANIETSPLAYTAGSAPVAVTSTLTVSSADATTLEGATVTVSSGLVASEDSLGFTNQNGITGSYNATTGVLTLTGAASLADYQAALRSVTYADSNAAAATSARTIGFQVNDGAAANNLSNTVSRTVSVATAPPQQADLSITNTDTTGGSVTAGGTTEYVIVVTNLGPGDVTGATVSDTMPTAITSDTWTVTNVTGGATATPGSGSGNLNEIVNMPAGSSITFAVNVNVDTSATGTISDTATVIPPLGQSDPNAANNAATDTVTVVT